MITIQTVMLVALGFLTAGFLVLLVMPFYRRRAERLAIAELKRTLPMSEAEIRAVTDRLRAEYAIRIHQLESRVDDAGHQAARQRIELNRRDGMISGLETEIAALRSTVEEHENARRVLEQTITDRLPKVEKRLEQARQMLDERDQEIERLSRSADTTARALDETRQINAQQRDELMRTNATLTTRAARNRDQLADTRFDGEVALRSEIEALRARAREQSEMITRLQGLLVRGGKSADGKANGEDAAASQGGGIVQEQEREIARLRGLLAERESSLKAAQSTAEAGKVGTKKSDEELRAAKLRQEELSAEVARLKASLAVYESAQKDEHAIKDSKVAMKARLGALEAEVATQTETIRSLRAEIAGANERLARQSAQYRDELRRLGAGTAPASAEPRTQPDQRPARRQSLAERMGAPRPVALKAVKSEPDAQSAQSFLKALTGREGDAQSQSAAAKDAATAAQSTAAAESAAAVSGKEENPPQAGRRSGLLDRISSISKS